jgi:hypothetical protein
MHGGKSQKYFVADEKSSKPPFVIVKCSVVSEKYQYQYKYLGRG